MIRHKYWLISFIVLFASALGFQNCSVQSKVQEKSKSSSSLQFGGNGEGYTGKVDGVYASVDTNGVCGPSSGGKFKVKDKVEVTNGKMAFTMKNCTPLAVPETVVNPSITTSQSKGEIFVLDTQMFQKGGFIAGGEAAKNEFVDFYCAGWDKAPVGPDLKRRVELAIFQGTDSFFSSPFYDQSWRKGLMRLLDVSVSTGKVTTEAIYNLDPLTQGTLPGVGFFLTPFFPGPDDFYFEYYEPNGVAPFDPNMTYNINNGPDRVADPMTCWQTF